MVEILMEVVEVESQQEAEVEDRYQLQTVVEKKEAPNAFV